IETLERLDELTAGIDHFEFYVFPHTDTALCRESTRTDSPPRPQSRAVVYAREVVLENWLGSGFAAAARRVPSAAPTLARIASKGTGRSHKLEDSFRVYASERRIRFTEMEFAIPRASAREATERVLEIASRRDLGIAWPIEVRFVAADDAMLSPSFERDSCYIAVHADPGGGWVRYFGLVAEVMADYGGRPHWGKRNPLNAGDLAQLYPRFDDFLRVRERLDPTGAFANGYTDRVLGPV
ncbi:MAG: oxidoreductase, partial [Actinomycetota bacterium]|nr:oxidoreductase [Actinomycetota bacterium]